MRTGVYTAPHPPRTPAGAHTGRQDRAPLPMRDGASAHRTAGVWCGVPWRGEAGTQHAHARRPPRTLCTRVAKSPLHKSSHGWALAISSLRFALPESSVLASPHRRTHVHALPTLSTAPMRAHLTRQPRAHAAARAAGRREPRVPEQRTFAPCFGRFLARNRAGNHCHTRPRRGRRGPDHACDARGCARTALGPTVRA